MTTTAIYNNVTDTAPVIELELSDLGNADRFYLQHREDLLYSVKHSTWLLWTGVFWELDECGKIYDLAGQAMRRIFLEAASTEDKDRAAKLSKWALRSQDRTQIEHMLALAKNKFAILIKDLDRDPNLLNCQNGTLDLRTGELRPHDPDDLITRIVNTSYYPDSECPEWDKFLYRIMGGNEEVITFLRRAVGYSLTGNTSEQCLFILHGNGANGKSTFLETLTRLLGDGYAIGTPTETIMLKRFDGGIPNDIARLKGARFVCVNEVEQGRRMAESKVKQMTGGDTITARFMRGEFFDFIPEYKLWIRANHKPEITGTDNAIWRRIRLIPFEVTILPAEQDPELMEKLSYEYPGILSWAVKGCMEWRSNRLQPPELVTKATDNYRAEMDLVGLFLAERTESTGEFTAFKTIYAAYTAWCEENSEHPAKQKLFSQALTERGYQKHTGTGGKRGFTGITLRVAD
jgi:putative DNA primase/helicase